MFPFPPFFKLYGDEHNLNGNHDPQPVIDLITKSEEDGLGNINAKDEGERGNIRVGLMAKRRRRR